MSRESEEQLLFEAMSAGDYDRAGQLSLPLVRQGSAYAMLILGFLHDHRKIEGASRTEAVACYRGAGQGGIVAAFYYLGMLLLEDGDTNGARQAFEQGVAGGSMQAMYGLGRCLEREAKTGSDREEAKRWFERAAAQGHFPAKRRLLGIEARRSLPARLLFIPRLLRLACRGLALHWKDKHSELLH